jgi:hypothetical protein
MARATLNIRHSAQISVNTVRQGPCYFQELAVLEQFSQWRQISQVDSKRHRRFCALFSFGDAISNKTWYAIA